MKNIGEIEYSSPNQFFDNLKYFQSISNQSDSSYENGGVKQKIQIEKILIECGPFLLNNKILHNSKISFINYDIDINRLTELELFILNNPEIKYDNDKKNLNRIFLETIHSDIDNIKKIESIPEIMTWDLGLLYNLFSKYINNMDKIELLISFDNTKFNIDEKKKFDFFCEILRKMNIIKEENNEEIQSFFNNFLLTKWKNIPNQIVLINLMITNKEISETSKFSLRNMKSQKVSKDIELKAYTSSKNHYLIDNWRNIKLIECLINISENAYFNEVKDVFDWALKNIPEIIIMALLVIKIDYRKNKLMNVLIIEILTPILFDKNPRENIIHEIWEKNKDIVIYVLYNSWENYPDLMNLSVIFDLTNNVLKDSLLPLVHSKYHKFSVNLGLLASKRDYLYIDKWLKNNIEEYGDEFIKALLEYLNINVIQPYQINLYSNDINNTNKINILEKAQLSIESLSNILKILNQYNNTDKISLKTKKEISDINEIIYNIYDEIQSEQINSEEIEKEASDILRPMYEGKISADNIINLLISYKASFDKKKNELFSCLIYQLIREYKNFNNYTNKDILKSSAELFGKIINNKLLDGLIETLALNYITESIKSESETLNFFGFTALSQFINNISWWPNYIKILKEIDKIKKNQNLFMIISKESEKIQKKYIFDKTQNNEIYNGLSVSNILIKKDSNINIPLENNNAKKNTNINNNNVNAKDDIINLEKIITQSKLIMENNSQKDILEKVSEINKFLGNDEKKNQIFAFILVTSKINQSKNIPFFNELFSRINSLFLYKYVLKYTIKYIHVLLKIENLYIEKKYFDILKNLGTWLGLITILKNKPIMVKDIDFRELITTSFQKGKLITTIPFVCKVFAFISKSKIFNSNNPWINSILCLLKEIFVMHNLNNLIRKEIQNFFEIIKIDINSIQINIQYLNKNDRVYKEIQNLDFPYWNKLNLHIEKSHLEKKISNLNDFLINLLSILNNDKNTFSDNIIQNLENFDPEIYPKFFENIPHVTSDSNKNNTNDINININYIEQKKELINLLTNLLYISILTLVPKLIDVYFYRPLASSMTIVNQDLIFEPDVNKYKTALNNILNSILSSFSMIGFHSMLKRNIGINLDICAKSRKLSKETISLIKELPNEEYINIGLDEIMKFLTKEAQNKLNSNEEYHAEIERRQGGNLNKNTMKNKFINFNEYLKNKIIPLLPTELKPSKNGISQEEYQIYENFKLTDIKIYEKEEKISTYLNMVCRLLKEVMDKSWEGNSSIKVSKYKNYELCLKNILNLCKNNDISYGINFFDEEQQLPLSFLKKIIIDAKIDKIDIINKMAMKTFDYVIIASKMNNYLLLSVYIIILRGWSQLNENINSQITKRIFENDFDVDIFTMFNYELHFFLFKQKLINYSLYESYIIDLFSKSSVIVSNVQNMLKSLFSSNNTINGINIKNYFSKIRSFMYNTKSCKNYYLLFNPKTSILINNGMNLNYIYKDIFSLEVQQKKELNIDDNKSELNEKKEKDLNNLYILFYTKITKLGNNLIYQKRNKKADENKIENLFNEKDILNCTKKLCEICMNNNFDDKFKIYSYFFYPEKFSIFVFYLINFKNIPFHKILDIIINNFHKDYISNNSFSQKKYYKFFVNLIYLITNVDSFDSKEKNINKTNYLILICDTLKIISPKNYPKFAMAWLDIVSYNYFITNFLDSQLIKENSFKYEKYLSLIIDILSFMNKNKSFLIKHFYFKFFLDEIYKYFYLLSKTYPLFISTYSYILISCLSLSKNQEEEDTDLFLQMRNIILSTNIDDKNNNKDNNNYLNKIILQENLIPEKIIHLITGDINKENKGDMQLLILMEKYLKEKGDENILDEIFEILDNIKNEIELNSVYNGLCIFWSKINLVKNKKIFYNFYLFLICNLNENHKKYLINSILNALKCPSTQTFDFSLLFQDLLLNIDNEDIEKQLIVNFLERFIYEPIPWGIKYTFKNLIKNAKFKKMEKNYLMEKEEIEYFIQQIYNNISSKDKDMSKKEEIKNVNV